MNNHEIWNFHFLRCKYKVSENVWEAEVQPLNLRERRKMMILQKIRFMFCGFWERFFDGFYFWTFILKFAFLNSQFQLKMSNFHPGFYRYAGSRDLSHFQGTFGPFLFMNGSFSEWKNVVDKNCFSLKVFPRYQKDHNPKPLQNTIIYGP